LALDPTLLPDPERLARAARAPAHGPRILFFSGGSALREASRALLRYTHRSVHLITPFDSGGSSARLRAALGMPSIGDLRNRLLALADDSIPAVREAASFLGQRLPIDGAQAALRARLRALVLRAPAMLREPLAVFAELMPDDFDLREASLGNLALAGAYLERGRDLRGALRWLADLLAVRAHVQPTVIADVHLAATLADGTRVVGQHRLTGKTRAPLRSPIAALELVDEHGAPSAPAIDAATAELIAAADLLCFPIGSFYTSVLANLLPHGVARAVRACRGRKVYVPNPGNDPEQLAMETHDCVAALLRTLHSDSEAAGTLLDTVLVDPAHGRYGTGLDRARIERLGPRVLEVPGLATDPGHADPQRLCEALVSLA
jgi:CofD-related protein of GAK system